MGTFVVIVCVVALVWVAFTTLWLWRNQERVVFQPPSVHVSAPAPARRVDYTASDGHPVFGYLVAPAGYASMTTIISYHGNADLSAWLVPWAQQVVERTGATVLLAEYRGYAGIPGSPTYENAAADALGALQFTQRQLRPGRIVLFGHSLGSAIAADVAKSMAPHALVLQSPFTSAREMATRMLVPPIPWLWKRISRVHYDTRAIVAALDAPVFVAHGTRDGVVPVRMGRQVFAAARKPGALLIADGAGHNDVADVAGDRYWRWLADAVTAEERPVVPVSRATTRPRP